jgi:hypothetical protein
MEDGRGGIAFGTHVAYDDIYGTHGDGGEFVSSLPTMDEELEEDSWPSSRMKARDRNEADDDYDAGRTSYHPSSIPKRMMQQVRNTAIFPLHTA